MWHRISKTVAGSAPVDVGWLWADPLFVHRLQTRLDHPPPASFSGRVFTTAFPGFSPIESSPKWGWGWAHLSQPDMASPNTGWWLGPRDEQQQLDRWLARDSGLEQRSYSIVKYG